MTKLISWPSHSGLSVVCWLILIVYCSGHLANAEEHLLPPVDFSTQIRPILSDKCFLCHGPDEETREAELRLDIRSSATEDRGDYAAILPGNAEDSELILRIASKDNTLVMPPEDSKKHITQSEIDLLKRWIDEGAVYSNHWAFLPPLQPEIPVLDQAGQQWSRTPIDAFIYKRLQREGLTPSERVEKTALLRRLHLDLTGLLPSTEELKAFVSDNSSRAFERQVERLLNSPHYGERWARHWLDAARYSDSDGYEKDMRRDNWFYRDWVINAINADKPYDEFIIEQLAGDLLPNAGQDEIVATGFLRNSAVNEEGGADPEQFRVEGLFDRMDAIGKAVLGLTTQCAQCHSHKYDPLTHHDYFGIFAYLNNCNETIITVFTPDEQQRLEAIHSKVAEQEGLLRQSLPGWREELSTWAETVSKMETPWQVAQLERENFTGQKFTPLEDGSLLSQSYAPPKSTDGFFIASLPEQTTAVRLELLNHPNLPHSGHGRSIYGTNALSEFEVAYVDADGQEHKVKVASATADVNIESRLLGEPFIDDRKGSEQRTVGPIDFAIDGDPNTAWTTNSGAATRNQPRKAVFVLGEPLANASMQKLIVRLVQNHGGKFGDQRHSNVAGCFRISVTNSDSPIADPLPLAVRKIVSQSPSTWLDDDWDAVFSYWRTTRPEWEAANERIDELLADHPPGTTQYVVSERSTPRITHRMDRGDFLSPAEIVEPHTPDFLHPLPKDAPANRLSLARWLVDRKSPTAARALVNRVWQAYFGTGLVETAEDLGSQARPPSHPQLLDWLAVEFMDSDWSLKHLHRLIVTSATYQQSSASSESLRSLDPCNRLLARGPRIRVEAEIVRDIALTASGLLDPRVGGPSVYPPAPHFLFVPPASFGPKVWNTIEETNSYRRSLYVQAYRSVPYPTMQVFDAPNGNTACVRRTLSNTPLQSLTLLNEPQCFECVQALGKRLLNNGGDSDTQKISTAYDILLSRKPSEAEIRTLTSFLADCRARLQEGDLEAATIAGVSAEAESEHVNELAAWTLVSRCLMNLDETITKQ